MRQHGFLILAFIGILCLVNPARSQSTYTLVDSVITYKYSALGDSMLYSKTVNITIDTIGEVRWIYSYRWDEEAGSWRGDLKSMAYLNEWNIISKFLDWNWDLEAGDWYLHSRYNVEVDLSGNITEEYGDYWDTANESWRGNTYATAEFDAVGNKLLETIFQWNSETGEWVNDEKFEFEYDSTGRVVQKTSYERGRDWDSWKEILRERIDYEFDEFQRVSVRTDLSWNKYSEIWEKQSRSEYQYAEGSNLSLKTVFSWADTEGWKLFSKVEYSYDARGNLILFLQSEWYYETWIGSYKKEQAFDDRDELIFEAIWKNPYWDHVEWIGYRRVEKAYDDLGNNIFYAYYFWDNQTASWEGSSQSRIWLDSNNRLDYFIDDIWNSDSADWQKYRSVQITYPDTSYRKIRTEYLMDANGLDSALQKKRFYYALGHHFHSLVDLCEGDSYKWKGEAYGESGFFEDGFSTRLGSDSIFTLDLRVHPIPGSFSISGDSELVKGQSGMYTVTGDEDLYYHWELENGAIVSGDSTSTLEVNWNMMGEGMVKAYAENQYGCASDTVRFDVNIGPNGLENPVSRDINIYPVPVQDVLIISNTQGRIDVEITDLSGRVMMRSEGKQINLSMLESGIYLVKILDQQKRTIYMRKILKE